MAKKKQFTLEWFKEFGWLNNPFRLEIFNPIDRYLAGLEKERQKLNYFIIENFSFGTIRADKGQGKTMLLLWLKQSLGEYKGTIVADYYKAEKRGVSLYEQVIDNLTGMKERLVMGSLFKLKLKKIFKRKKDPLQAAQSQSIYDKLYHRNTVQFDELLPFFEKKLNKQRLVLLIDDGDLLSEKDISFLEFLLSSGLPVQAIVTLDSDAKFSIQTKDVLKMKLSELSFKEMKQFLHRRIQSVGGDGVEPFNDHVLHSIYAKGKKNPLHILKIAYDQAVKLSLKHLADRKKGIVPKKVKKQMQEEQEEFDEIAEYNKLLAEERRKHDLNSMIMGTKIEKEEPRQQKKEKKKEVKAEDPKTSALPSEQHSYNIQVIEHESTRPIEIMGMDDEEYTIKEVKRSKNPSSTKKKTKTRSKKKAVKKVSKKKVKKKTKSRRKRSKKKR